MRLFTAIELSDAARADLAGAIETVRRRALEQAPRARVTWVAPDRLHLTLRFIGEVDDAAGERILRVLRDPLPVAPFELTFNGFGAFPPKGPPRVIWVGVAPGGRSLEAAESYVSDRLETAGVARDDRPYTPHLTLGRVRDAAGLRTSLLFDGVRAPDAETRVDAITLFRSQLSPKGPAYTALQRTRLQPPRTA